MRAAAKLEAVRTLGRALKPAAMFIAAPVIGLAYMIFLPFIGLGMLAWMGARAALATR
jgi:hypothetical protein